MRPYWTGARRPGRRLLSRWRRRADQRWARCSDLQGAWLGTSKTCRHGRAVTVGDPTAVRRSPNRRRGHDPQHGPTAVVRGQRVTLSARLDRLACRTCATRLRVRLWVPLAQPSLRAACCHQAPAPLEPDDAVPQGRRPTRARHSPGASARWPAQRPLAPFKALTTEGCQEDLAAVDGLVSRRSSCQRDSFTGPQSNDMAASTAGVRPPARPCNAGPSGRPLRLMRWRSVKAAW